MSEHQRTDDERVRLQRHEEELVPERREVELGRVVIRKRVERQPVEQTVELAREHVRVERIPVGRVVESAPPPRFEGETLIISVVEEELVVQKRLVLREEVRITRERATEQQTVSETLRREVVEVAERSAD
jgi:uncharacterized protein (TIGR02271 family)